MRVVERGSGETMACGTGACAVTAAAVWQGYCRYDENVEVRQPGGILTTAYLADGRMLMEGPTEYVFEGYFDIPIASFITAQIINKITGNCDSVVESQFPCCLHELINKN